MSEPTDQLAAFLSNEVVGDFVFDGNDHGAAPKHYRDKAAALLGILRTFGWRPPTPADDKLPLIGMERSLVDGFTKTLHNTRGSTVWPISETRRGNIFDVRLAFGRIARVTVELDRIEGHDDLD